MATQCWVFAGSLCIICWSSELLGSKLTPTAECCLPEVQSNGIDSSSFAILCSFSWTNQQHGWVFPFQLSCGMDLVHWLMYDIDLHPLPGKMKSEYALLCSISPCPKKTLELLACMGVAFPWYCVGLAFRAFLADVVKLHPFLHSFCCELCLRTLFDG
jgi:hypothetical protein